MSLRTRAICGALLVLTLTVPLVSSALTTDEILAQIQSYRDQVRALQQQLNELRHLQDATSTPPTPLPRLRERRACALLTRDIPFGSTSDVIWAIQEALAEDRTIYPEGLTTGYFGPLTQSAFQRLRDRLIAQGFATTTLPLDERTRIGWWMRGLLLRYWCPSVPLPSPPGLTCPLPATTTPTESCAGMWERLEGIRGCHVGWRCMPIARTLNQQPSIQNFEGPTELAVHEIGTWTVSASDQENDALTHKIMWGDESVQEQLQSFAELDSGAFTSTTTFTHAYGRAGRYAVHIAVRDGAGNTAHAIATVKVTSDTATIACTQEAKQCPDGSYVGRTGPNCEFKCPATPRPFPLPDDQALKDKVCPFLKDIIENPNVFFAEGEQGDHVRGIQALLHGGGFLNVNPTGYFGLLTRNALLQWQNALADLPVPTGIGYPPGSTGFTYEMLQQWQNVLADLPTLTGIGYPPGPRHWSTADRANYEQALQRIRSWCEA